MSAWFDIYLKNARLSILNNLQYQVASYFYMIGMIAEPVIYLIVWSTVAKAQGGVVAGYTAGGFAAYYIVWTLVRIMNIVLTPYYWEIRIKEGRLAGELLKPIHPYHLDLGGFIGWKFLEIVRWLPIAAVLILVFKPDLHPTGFEVAAFFVAIWGGFFVRFGILWALGLLSFWTTRVSAIFELYFTIELLTSGRLVPLSLMPGWVQTTANFLPFKWAFGFPIEVLIGQLSPQAIFTGLGAQLFWSLLGVLIMRVVWNSSIKRFSAVGA